MFLSFCRVLRDRNQPWQERRNFPLNSQISGFWQGKFGFKRTPLFSRLVREANSGNRHRTGCRLAMNASPGLSGFKKRQGNERAHDA
jgi:hypothetical protein